MTVTIVDYGLSNLLSVQRAVEKLGFAPHVTQSTEEVQMAETLILPGVGAFRDGMAGLCEKGLADAMRAKASGGTPLLGICLGMQMLFAESEENGRHEGLCLLEGRVARIPDCTAEGAPQRVPHVGWNALVPPEESGDFPSPLLADIQPGSEVYFVHSFEAHPAGGAQRLANTPYGGRPVCAATGAGRVFGTQFHPEKSGDVGLRILRNFLAFAVGQ